MEEEIATRKLSPALMIVVTLVAVFLGLQLVGPIIGFFISAPFYSGSVMEMAAALRNPTLHPELKMPLFIMQGLGTLVGLIIVPALLLRRQQTSVVNFFRQPLFIQPVFLVVAIVMVFMVADSVFIEWNQDLKLPESLTGFEKWAKGTEEKLTELTRYLTQFDSIGQVVIAMIVIAVLPAVGEEIVFRGIIQQELFRSTKNIHLSIWISAFVFSAFHIQFYGLVPRMLLGALFGYLYYWSGSLTMAALAHFVNNGFAVITMYLYQQGLLDIDLETPESAPWPAVFTAMIATGVLLFLFKKFFENRLPANPSAMDGSNLSSTLK